MSVEVRTERADDRAAIRALTAAAFKDMPHSDGREPEIVDQLREDGDLTLSLVAENSDKAIIGHIAFSPVAISDGTTDWYALGPVSVIPTIQHTGIGTSLIECGILMLTDRGAKGIVLLGEPEYYSRFGFEHDPDLAFPGAEPAYFQRFVLSGDGPKGTVTYPPAFG